MKKRMKVGIISMIKARNQDTERLAAAQKSQASILSLT